MAGPLVDVDGPAADGDTLRYDGTAKRWRRNPPVTIGSTDTQDSDDAFFGDILSPCRRTQCSSTFSFGTGGWWQLAAIATRTARVTRLRLWVSSAGVTLTPATAIPIQIRDATNNAAQPVLATVAMTAGGWTPIGMKELSLSVPIDLVAGKRYSLWFLIATGAVTVLPTWLSPPAVSAGGTGFLLPTWAHLMGGLKVGTPGAPPAGVDSSWTLLNQRPWWALAA